MRRSTAWWMVLAGVVLVVAAAAALIAIEVERRSTIEVERQLAEPFLALDEQASLREDYGSVPPDPLGADLGSVTVTFPAGDPDVTVEGIQSTMRAEGWESTLPGGMEWHSGGGELGHRWGMIRVAGDEVTLFIGRIEG